MVKAVAKKSSQANEARIAAAQAGGILPSQEIKRLISAGALILAEPIVENQLQPASLDLRLGPVAYRVRASFLPQPGSRVQTKLDELSLHTISLSQGAVLETGCVYIVPLLESLALPEGIDRKSVV